MARRLFIERVRALVVKDLYLSLAGWPFLDRGAGFCFRPLDEDVTRVPRRGVDLLLRARLCIHGRFWSILPPSLVQRAPVVPPSQVGWTLIAWLCVVAVSSFMLLTKLAFGQRFGQVIPLGVIFLFLVGSSPIRNRFPSLWAGISEFLWRPCVLIPAELLIIGGLWHLMCRWVTAKDTPQLID